MLLMMPAGAPAATKLLRIGGTGGALPVMQVLAEEYVRHHPHVTVNILGSLGSAGGISALIDGALDVAVSSRAPTGAEAAAGVTSFPYARAAFVFATHAGNAATGVTREDIARWYASGGNWPDGTPVTLVLRLSSDADTDLVRSLSPAVRSARDAAQKRDGMLFAVTDQDSASFIEKLRGSLGTATLPQLLAEKRKVRLLALDGVAPTAENIAAGRYGVYKDMYVVLRQRPGDIAADFVSFVLSPPAQRLLRELGTLPG
ncbi:MAG TPA: substrate-binding domain-containing protein, partial [Burkholderiales bacterium]|nr:substrate-binding domain-containing protein [Burkholderiales bacterium]